MVTRRDVLVGSSLALLASGQALAALPGTSVWTSYDLGSSGYAEASGIADAIMKKHPIRVRIVPSGTSIGRLLPLKQGRATYGFLATELYFSTEATYDFAVPAWGPQDVRIVLARAAGGALAVAGYIGVKEIKAGDGVVEVTPVAGGARPVHILKLTLVAAAPGALSRSLEISTDHPEQPTVVVPLVAKVTPK